MKLLPIKKESLEKLLQEATVQSVRLVRIMTAAQKATAKSKLIFKTRSDSRQYF